MRGKLCGVKFLAVALVLSCVAGGSCITSCVKPGTNLSCVASGSCVTGRVLSDTLLQVAPGRQEATICTTLLPGYVVDVDCRTEDVVVFDDPWWLSSSYILPNGTAAIGWVADYFIDCGSVSSCNVSVC